jgi:hypothetical protein
VDLNILGGGLHQWKVNNYGNAVCTTAFLTMEGGAEFNNYGSFDLRGNTTFLPPSIVRNAVVQTALP